MRSAISVFEPSAAVDHPLLDIDSIDQPPIAYLQSIGEIVATFGPPEQDSGNLSYGLECGGRRFFVKTTDPGAAVLLDYPARVGLLRNAGKIADDVDHRALPELFNIVESPHGPMLVYEWMDGELLRARGDGRESAHLRFRRLPVDEILIALDEVIELHVLLAASGYVAVDFYDGCLIYDFASHRIHVVDLDHYHQGAFQNGMGRMFGSTRFMAPEELEYGRLIDERTTLFNMARVVVVFLSDGTLNRNSFRGSSMQHEVIVRTCEPRPEARFQSMREFDAAWREVR